MPRRARLTNAFTLLELLTALGLFTVILVMTAYLFQGVRDHVTHTTDVTDSAAEAQRVFQQIELAWQNRVGNRNIALILQNPAGGPSATPQPALQWITHSRPPDAYRFPHDPGEPARGLSTVSFRLRTFTHGLELQTGTAAFSMRDSFTGLLTPPFSQLGTNLPGTLDTRYLTHSQLPRVPLENWAVPEDHFEPLSQQALGLALDFQLRQSYTDPQTGQIHPPGTVLHQPPLIERPPGSGFTQVDLPKIGAIHITLAIGNQTLLRQLDPQVLQQYAQWLATAAHSTPTNQLTTQTWQTALTTKSPPADIPPTLHHQTRIYHHVLFLPNH